jgi:hypothetical protein
MSDAKRFRLHHPELSGQVVVLAREYDVQTAKLEDGKSQCNKWAGMHARLEAECLALRDELAQLRGEVSNELRLQILHMRREVVRQDRSPLPVRQKMVQRLTNLLNRWARGSKPGAANLPFEAPSQITTPGPIPTALTLPPISTESSTSPATKENA